MDISEMEKSFLFTTKFEFEDEGNNFIVLREPTTLEMKELADSTKNSTEILIKIFPGCIIEHSFTKQVEGQTVLANGKEVTNILVKMGTLFTRISNQWVESLPLKKANAEK